MADRVIQILTPAASHDLITLDEAKLLMGMSTTDTGMDAQIALWIDMNSQTVARLCNRVFAREEVAETWRDLNDGDRLFLSHWPILTADVESVESPAGSGTLIDPAAWELEEGSGKLTIGAGYAADPVTITYWGGYVLPDEAPAPLKQATALLNAQSKLLSTLGSSAGVRMIAHKEKRVAYHDPNLLISAAMGGKGSGTETAIMNILSRYMRYEA